MFINWQRNILGQVSTPVNYGSQLFLAIDSHENGSELN